MSRPPADVDQIQPATARPHTVLRCQRVYSESLAAPTTDNRSASVPLPVGPLRDLDLELRVPANELIAGGQSITDAQVFMRVRDGLPIFEYIRGVLHEGQLDTRMMLNARRPIVEAEIEGGLKGVNMDLLSGQSGQSDAASGRIEMGWDLNTQGATK